MLGEKTVFVGKEGFSCETIYTRGAGLGWRCPCVNAGELIPYLTRN